MTVPPFFRIPAHVDGAALFAAAERVEGKLQRALPAIDRALLAIRPDHTASVIPDPQLPSEYWPEWFRRKIDNSLAYLQIYAYIIAQTIPKDRALRELALLDFGAGWGLMALLAKEAGFGRVTYLDIDPGVTTAARAISETVDVRIDDYICGSETALAGRPQRFDCVVSSDALEHIYQPRKAFAAIRGVCHPNSIVFHHTGANPRNLHQRITLARLQRAEEAKIVEQRRQLIRETAPDLALERVAALATSTRGLDRADIISAVAEHRRTGALPTPDHPTNTCYLSGYWLEHLMEPSDVARMMSECGYSTTVERSFWGPGRSRFVPRIAKHALNFLSSLSTGIGLKATYYYGIRGVAI
ncbi:MAG: class I SAM-dependent methyltransferase [Gemmatimonadaceae bacterium]